MATKDTEQIMQPCPIITNTSNGANGYSPNKIRPLFAWTFLKVGSAWENILMQNSRDIPIGPTDFAPNQQ